MGCLEGSALTTMKAKLRETLEGLAVERLETLEESMTVGMDVETAFQGVAWWGISNMEDGVQVVLRTFFFHVRRGEIREPVPTT